MKYYSVIKKNKPMLSAATWMDLENIILSEVSQEEEDKYHMIPLITCNLKYDTNEFMKQTHRHRQQIYGYQRRKVWRRDKLGLFNRQIQTTIYKINKILQYSTENNIQNPVTNHSGKEYVYRCIYSYTHIYN